MDPVHCLVGERSRCAAQETSLQMPIINTYLGSGNPDPESINEL